ncbi:hypothetical protein [Paenibacillus sp. D9]|nr:hypothetical protein [Paenibacillus sp. D9]
MAARIMKQTAYGEFFRNVQPAAAMVVVKALIDPRLLIQIEAEATVGE